MPREISTDEYRRLLLAETARHGFERLGKTLEKLTATAKTAQENLEKVRTEWDKHKVEIKEEVE